MTPLTRLLKIALVVLGLQTLIMTPAWASADNIGNLMNHPVFGLDGTSPDELNQAITDEESIERWTEWAKTYPTFPFVEHPEYEGAPLEDSQGNYIAIPESEYPDGLTPEMVIHDQFSGSGWANPAWTITKYLKEEPTRAVTPQELEILPIELQIQDIHRYTKGAGATIALIDGGISPWTEARNHLDPRSRSFTTDDPKNIVTYGMGHGGLMAALIGDKPRNIDGYQFGGGLAPEANIIHLRTDMPDQYHANDPASTYEAIDYAIGQNVDVINLSKGFPSLVPNTGYSELVDRAEAKGILIVSSAGNSDDRNNDYKGLNSNLTQDQFIGLNQSNNLIMVNALGWNTGGSNGTLGKATYSGNFGPKTVHLATQTWLKGLPDWHTHDPTKGVPVKKLMTNQQITDWENNWLNLDGELTEPEVIRNGTFRIGNTNAGGTSGGTSGASAIMSGAAALIKSIRPEWGAADIRNVLMNTSQSLDTHKGKNVVGGAMNLTAAINAARAGTNNTKRDWPYVWPTIDSKGFEVNPEWHPNYNLASGNFTWMFEFGVIQQEKFFYWEDENGGGHAYRFKIPDGWEVSKWFGWSQIAGQPWIWKPDWGWLYIPIRANPEGFWAYHLGNGKGLGWVFIARSMLTTRQAERAVEAYLSANKTRDHRYSWNKATRWDGTPWPDGRSDGHEHFTKEEHLAMQMEGIRIGGGYTTYVGAAGEYRNVEKAYPQVDDLPYGFIFSIQHGWLYKIDAGAIKNGTEWMSLLD